MVNPYFGYAQNYDSGVPWNTGGSFDLDTEYYDPAPSMTGLTYDDNQQWTINNPIPTVSSGGTTYQWSYIGYTKLDYHLILQRSSGHAQVAQFNWGFQWDNYNDTWPSPGAPFGYGYTSYGGVSGTTGPAGEFYGMYGISGL